MEALLLLIEVKRTGWGKLSSNSKPVCDRASWCCSPATNIKRGVGMGFQPGSSRRHAAASSICCWQGSCLLGEQGSSPLPAQLPPPPINHTNCRQKKKKHLKIRLRGCAGSRAASFHLHLWLGCEAGGDTEGCGDGAGDGASPGGSKTSLLGLLWSDECNTTQSCLQKIPSPLIP